MTSSALYLGDVMHRRLRPRSHQLRYRIFSLLLDLDEVDVLDRSLRLFSRNRFNLFAFHDRDYGDGSGDPLRTQVERHLQAAGVRGALGEVTLLTMPRILGFAFNPLSLYFCRQADGALIAILYEVHNTFGERHTYVLSVEGDDAEVRHSCDKRFHVSPFLPMKLRYRFRVHSPEERLRVGISVCDDEGAILVAVQSGKRRMLSDANLLRSVLTHPLMTWKVVSGILLEAARLWLKRVPVHRHVAAPAHSASFGEDPKVHDPGPVATKRMERRTFRGIHPHHEVAAGRY